MLRIRDTKSGKSRYAYLTSRAKRMLGAKLTSEPSVPVFPGSYDHKCRLITKYFNGAVVELGLNDGIKDHRQKVVFHTLRHTFASWHAMNGTPLAVLKELLGHSSYAMVERYAHLSDQKRIQSVSVIENNIVLPTVKPQKPDDQKQEPKKSSRLILKLRRNAGN